MYYILCSLRHQILYILAITMSFGMALEGRALPPLQAEWRWGGGTCLWCPPASTTYAYSYLLCVYMYASQSKFYTWHNNIIMVQSCVHNFIRNGTIAYIHVCTYYVPTHVHTLWLTHIHWRQLISWYCTLTHQCTCVYGSRTLKYGSVISSMLCHWLCFHTVSPA